MTLDFVKRHWLKLLLIPLLIGMFSLTSVVMAQEEEQETVEVTEWETRQFATLEQRQQHRGMTMEQRCEADQWVVRGGETLGQIMIQCNVSLAAILAANPQISDPDMVWVGEVVNVPEEPFVEDLFIALTPPQQDYMLMLAERYEAEVVPVTGLEEAGMERVRRTFATDTERQQARQMTFEQRCAQDHWVFLPGESLGHLTTICGFPLDVMLAHNHQVGNPNLVFAFERISIPDDPFAPWFEQPMLTAEQLENLQEDFDVTPVEDDAVDEDEDDEDDVEDEEEEEDEE
jgi:LysM repeat protein